MGFLYEAIDRAKQAIQQNSRYHSTYNDIIDKRWKFMHSDLHSAGYFLNPQFQYGVAHGDDVYEETFEGTARVIAKLVRRIYDQIKALNQLKMRQEMRRSQEEIETSFDPINLNYIFQEDPLSEWIEERENPLLDGVQNAEWLHIEDTDDGDGGGLSPPSGNSGNEEAGEGGGGGGGDDDEEDAQVDHDPYSETPPIYRRYRNLTDMGRSDGSLLNSGGDVSHSRSRRGKRKQNVPLEDSSSSSIAQSFSDFGIGDSSQNSQQSYPPIYQYPYFNSYNQYASDQAPSNYQQAMNYQDPYYEQSSGGFFGYVFGQGATQDDSQSESTSNAPPRHSTMW
ncbi:unnamed protein product [Trifolium pratense]|uniref:Uncharacterized protein n=1 Tax=Trifolium pratense TaxID=57577 RepID=A0ACB0KJ89_TRIPR|nr:unnamed protein product [Trifolium pratense]